jgi:hypothetical protein
MPDWSRLQTDQYLPSGLLMTVNIGDGSNNGIELEAAWRPDSHWQVARNLLVRILAYPDVQCLSGRGSTLVCRGVSSVLGSVDLLYRWPVAQGWHGEGDGGQVAYVGTRSRRSMGPRPAEWGTTRSPRLGLAFSSGPTLSAAFPRQCRGRARNTFSFGNPFSRTRARQSTPLRPRTVTLSLSRDF